MGEVKVGKDEISSFLREAFITVGATEEQADAVVHQLVWTSLRGVETHGLVLTERYIEGIRNGDINTRPSWSILKETPSTAVIDADFGLGAYIATRATEVAVEKAKSTGIAAVFLKNPTHCGALSYFGFLAAEEKTASLSFTNATPLSAPWGGYTPVFGTNPFCFSFPYKNEHVILDVATTVVAGQKIVLSMMDELQIPLGWALDKEGRPTTDPKEAMEGALLPFGGHKGYGLMLAAEMYSSILGGGVPSYQSGGRYFEGGFYIQALNVEALRNYREYEEEFQNLIDRIKSSKVAQGHEAIYLPGEIERITAKKRAREGIPVDRQTWDYFMKIQHSLGLKQRLTPFTTACT